MNRRQTFKLAAGAAAMAVSGPLLVGRSAALAQAASGPFKLPPLGYAYDALEPHIDAATMGIHHKNHHQGYINALNGLVGKWPDLGKKPAEEIFAAMSSVPEEVRTPVRNNLGGQDRKSVV